MVTIGKGSEIENGGENENQMKLEAGLDKEGEGSDVAMIASESTAARVAYEAFPSGRYLVQAPRQVKAGTGGAGRSLKEIG